MTLSIPGPRGEAEFPNVQLPLRVDVFPLFPCHDIFGPPLIVLFQWLPSFVPLHALRGLLILALDSSEDLPDKWQTFTSLRRVHCHSEVDTSIKPVILKVIIDLRWQVLITQQGSKQKLTHIARSVSQNPFYTCKLLSGSEHASAYYASATVPRTRNKTARKPCVRRRREIVQSLSSQSLPMAPICSRTRIRQQPVA